MKKLGTPGIYSPSTDSSIITSALCYVLPCSDAFSFDEDDEEASGLEKNLGQWDRSLRIASAIIVIALIFFHGGLSRWIVFVIGIQTIYFIVTGLAGFCPVYAKLGVDTVNRAGYVHDVTLKKDPD